MVQEKVNYIVNGIQSFKYQITWVQVSTSSEYNLLIVLLWTGNQIKDKVLTSLETLTLNDNGKFNIGQQNT
jgi:hypothetical protein